MGHDAALMPAQPLPALVLRAVNERRTVVTRNCRIRPGSLFRVVQLQSHALEPQLRQLVRELGLPVDEACAFTRCDVCNVPIEPVDKRLVEGRVPPYVWQTQSAFQRCPACGRMYWAATHWDRARALFARLREEAAHA